ncbi:MAG: succinylglutamate desuccinylase/aspartoacylase family protein [Planctomycetota bacterium]
MSTATQEFQRRLGRYTSGRPGPTVVVCGGLHGNEPAGALAAQNVLERLERDRPPLEGELLAVAGNLAALAAGRRYLAVDLNRAWRADHVHAVRNGGPRNPEEEELGALLEVFDSITEDAPLILFDLHTTSGDSPPFTIMSDTLRNRRIALALPPTAILGLEETVDGTLLEYLTERGHTAVVVEAGQHDAPESVAIHEAVIWMGLAAAGALRPLDIPDYAAHRARLRAASRGLPRVVELRHRHPVAEADGFRMEPGYRGLQPVAQGELLGYDRRGEVRAPRRGRIVLPLYQELGDDGFFLVRSVSRFWLGLSSLLRRLRLGRMLPWFPGVEAHPEQPNALRVDPKVARWLVVEVFHLFGYRRRRPEGDHLVFSRRRPD